MLMLTSCVTNQKRDHGKTCKLYKDVHENKHKQTCLRLNCSRNWRRRQCGTWCPGCDAAHQGGRAGEVCRGGKEAGRDGHLLGDNGGQAQVQWENAGLLRLTNQSTRID